MVHTFSFVDGYWCLQNPGGWQTLLHRILVSACVKNNVKAARSALKHGLDLLNRTQIKADVAYIVKINYIHIAAICGSKDVVKMLLDVGTDVDLQSSEGYTSLHMAIMHKHYAVVLLLLERRANVNHKTILYNVSPLESACSWYLLPNGDTNDMSAILKSDYNVYYNINFAIVEILLKNGANPHAENFMGKTPKQCAEDCRDKANQLAVANYNAVIAFLEKAMLFQITGPPVPHAKAVCSICLEDNLMDFCQLPCCSQRFHVHCISQWFDSSDTKLCPLCRGQMTSASPVVRNVCPVLLQTKLQ